MFRYIKIDETEHWDESFVKKLGCKLEATYIFDDSVCTYCCESTPSYFLRYAGTDIITDAREINDQDYENILESESNCDNDHYQHCWRLTDCKPIPYNNAETLDETIEEFHANPW